MHSHSLLVRFIVIIIIILADQNSSNIFQTSPKFYRNISFDSLKENNDSKLRVFEMAKDENYSVRLNSSAQSKNIEIKINYI